MARRRIEGLKMSRLEARVRAIRGASRLALILFCAALGSLVVATAFPQRKELDRLTKLLDEAKMREAEVLAEREHREIEFRALQTDPTFQEMHARDRLDYCLPGERVIKLHRDP